MKTKQRILKALDCALEDISEERLIDIFIDAYNEKKKRIAALEGENAHELLMLQTERDSIRTDMRRMRSDPLFGASGEYFFILDGKKFAVSVIGGLRIELVEQRDGVCHLAQQISREQWKP